MATVTRIITRLDIAQTASLCAIEYNTGGLYARKYEERMYKAQTTDECLAIEREALEAWANQRML